MALVLLGLMTLIALIALAFFFAYHRRELRRLHHHHRAELRQADDDHSQRIKRLGREHTLEVQFAHHPVVRDLLPALDALDEGLRHADEKSDPGLTDGLSLARKGLLQALERHGVERIEPGPGDDFDPQWHEAIATRESLELPAGKVASCLRAGYRDGERELRAAMVEVAAAPQTSPQREPFSDAPSSEDSSEDDPISSAATSRSNDRSGSSS